MHPATVRGDQSSPPRRTRMSASTGSRGSASRRPRRLRRWRAGGDGRPDCDAASIDCPHTPGVAAVDASPPRASMDRRQSRHARIAADRYRPATAMLSRPWPRRWAAIAFHPLPGRVFTAYETIRQARPAPKSSGLRACPGLRLWKTETVPSHGPTGRRCDHRVVTVHEVGRGGNAVCPNIRWPSMRRPIRTSRCPKHETIRDVCV